MATITRISATAHIDAPSEIVIRPFATTDYAPVIEVVNAVFSEYPETIEEWRHYDEHRDPRCKYARWVAELDGTIVGYGNYDQFPWMYHPQKFAVFAAVRPDFQGRGVGMALYEQIVAALEPFEPLGLRANVREDMERSTRFLKDRGFVEDMRSWESRLDVPSFDATPYADAEQRMAVQGIVIKTMRELEGDPQRDQKLFELDSELGRDVPSPEPHTPISYERFADVVFKNPNLLPDAYFVALDGDTYVASTSLWSSQASADELYNGLTAVRRSHRRRGIALALKLRGIAYARAQGIKTIKTWNESNNRAMLSINEQLGFVKQPIWINFVKNLV